jgi:superfamily II DNA or RNA helicase
LKLRSYQSQIVESVFNEWKSGVRSTLVVVPTGGGKTIIFADIVQKMQPKRALILAHREELIWQARDKIEKVTGLKAEIEMGQYKASMNGTLFHPQAKVVIATVQTLSSGGDGGGRMTKFNPLDFGLLIIDECHRSTASSYKKILNYFIENNPELVVLGVTATPIRSDEEALKQVFESAPDSQKIGMRDLINQGWLVPILQLPVYINSIDIGNVRTKGGDLHGPDLDAVMTSEKPLHGLAKSAIEILGDRAKGIGFTSSVEHSRLLSDICNRRVPGISAWLCGDTDKNVRRKVLSDFKLGAIRIIWNCDVLSEGFDEDSIDYIFQGRPTKSLLKYTQQIGRGTRPHVSIADALGNCPSAGIRRGMILRSCKPHMTVIDYVGNSGKHKLVTAIDVLGGNVSPAILQEVMSKAIKSGKPIRVDKSIEEEEKIAEEKRARELVEKQRKAKLILEAKYTIGKSVDPFDILDIKPVAPRGYESNKPLTENMSKFLREKMGLNPDNFTFTQAGQLIGEQKRRWDQGLCSLKQAKWLKKNGYDSNVKFKDASAIMTSWANNGWRRPPSNQLPPSVAEGNKIEVPHEWETAGGIVDSENPF